MASEFTVAVQAGAAGIGVAVADESLAALDRYAAMLLEWNGRVNLTAITEPGEVARKHFVDSLSLLRRGELLADGRTLADVGSGAGFPGLVLAAVRPGLKVTLIDSLAKRIAFLQAVIAELGLRNVTAVHLRAEDAGHQAGLREGFDVVTARAVAPLATLAEYCLPLAHVGGSFLAMKGPTAGDEIRAAERAVAVLGGEVAATDQFTLPGTGEGRSLVQVVKARRTPREYPRRAGTPQRQPL